MKRPEKNLIQNATVKPWKHLDGSLIQSPDKDKRNVSVDARQIWYVGLTLIHSTLLDVHLERCFSLPKYHVNLNNQFRVPRVRNVYIHIFARINSRLIVVVGTYTLPKITSRDLQQRDSMVSLSMNTGGRRFRRAFSTKSLGFEATEIIACINRGISTMVFCKISVRRSKCCLEFFITRERLKIPTWSLSNKFPTIFWSLIFQISPPRLGYFSYKKGSLNFSDSKMWWTDKSEQFSLSQ